MRYQYFFLFLFSITLLTACQDKIKEGGKMVEEIPATAQKVRNSDIIRSPVTADAPIDTVNVAKITFEEMEYDFGTIIEGRMVNHDFKFVNTGKVPLIISDARSTCGCTVPNWSKKPIAPGESGKIAVQFNSTRKPNNQRKAVTITANTYPSKTRIFIKGYVHPTDAGKKKN